MKKLCIYSYLEGNGIEEVFLIQTEEIDFFGALVKERGGKCSVNGNVLFQDETRWFFHYPAGERDVLRNRLLSICNKIAQFYGTEVFSKKFDNVIAYKEFANLLREAERKMN